MLHARETVGDADLLHGLSDQTTFRMISNLRDNLLEWRLRIDNTIKHHLHSCTMALDNGLVTGTACPVLRMIKASQWLRRANSADRLEDLL